MGMHNNVIKLLKVADGDKVDARSEDNSKDIQIPTGPITRLLNGLI